MIDESLFQYLQHSIHKTLKASKSNEELRLLLEKIGFSVGHGVIEKEPLFYKTTTSSYCLIYPRSKTIKTKIIWHSAVVF